MRNFFSALFTGVRDRTRAVKAINEIRSTLSGASDEALRLRCRESDDLNEVIAITAITAEGVLGLRMFDVQLEGALALAEGRIAEMQTGEGKTLAATPAVIWFAKAGGGVHVMTVNDYLARRDAQWMGAIYQRLGFTVGCVLQEMNTAQRQAAYACDITYATANEIGFDYLRDQLALRPEEIVHRPFAAALIDEADSILIDEARIPLVIAGGEPELDRLSIRADNAVRSLRHGFDFTTEQNHRNVVLTDQGIREIEARFELLLISSTSWHHFS